MALYSKFWVFYLQVQNKITMVLHTVFPFIVAELYIAMVFKHYFLFEVAR